MSVSGGPDVVDNGLVMYLDTTNLRSFRGEPTTNTISEPFALNGNPGITTGYEASFERVSGSNLPTTAMASISPVWLKFTKTSPTNGRVWFLGTPITYKTGSTDYCYSGYVYTDDTRVTSLTLGTDNVAVSTTQTTLSSWSTGDINSIKRIAAVWRSLSGSSSHGLRIGSTNPTGSTFYMTAFQNEEKSYPTPVVNGTRGTTVATGGGWGDITGNSNNGELVNGPTYSSSRGGSIVFDGINDSVQLQSSSAINNLTQNFSVEAVVLFTTSSGQYGIVSKGTTFTQGWCLYLRQGPQFSFIGYDTFGTSSGIFATPAGEVTSNTWYHVAYTYDNTRICGYINGQEKVSSAYTQTFSSVGTTPIIGRDSSIASPQYWPGNIASVKLYNRTLTPLEILQNFNAIRSRFGI